MEEVVEGTEGAEEEEEIGISLYYDRCQEEREKRYASELARLENSIHHNSPQSIGGFSIHFIPD